MKKIMGMTFGGLQKKMVRLVMLVLCLAIGALTVVSFFQDKMLIRLVEDTRIEQQQAISGISKETMSQVLEDSFVRMTGVEAENADHEFSEVVTDITILQSMAEELLKNRDSVAPVMIGGPDISKDGTASAFALSENGVDYTKSELLGAVAHMSSTMIAMLNSSEKISSCFIGLADGTHLAADNTTADKLDEKGNQIPFAVRQRPWYRGAVEDGGIHFTGVIRDAFDSEMCVTCSVPIFVDDKIMGVVGIDINMASIDESIASSSGEGGCLFIVNNNGQVIFAPENNGLFKTELAEDAADLRESSNQQLAQFIRQALREKTNLMTVNLSGKDYYIAGVPMPTVGWAMIMAVDKELTEQPEKQLLAEYDSINADASAAFRAGNAKILGTFVLLVLAVILIGSYLALSASRNIVKPIEEMTKDINRSSETGSLFVMKDTYRTDDEIEVLAEAFTDLSKRTKQYIADITEITREKERVSTELHMANRIQNSMLPGVFPPFPDRREFDIYATMGPAREVGGDFYDFFLIDEDHLGMVMADVSGKGVPAALFMMISKVILQSYAMLGQSPSEILNKTNEAICSSNQEDMFVTVWIGILEISTGKIMAANAGHEYPALKQDGKFALLRDKHGLVLGGMEGIIYTDYEIKLNSGDKLFLYTDGIPEAADASYNMFGTDGMLEALNKDVNASPREILNNVQEAVESFVNGAEQFDDMTMLCLEYKGRENQSGIRPGGA